MPEYLTLNGVPIPCRAPGGGGLAEPERSGEMLRMHDNSLTSSENPAQHKRVWNFQTIPLTAAEWLAIEPLLKGGIIRTADGYAITRGGGSVAVYVRRREVQHEPNTDTDFGYMVAFSCYEVYGLATGGVSTQLYMPYTTSPDDDGLGAYPTPDGSPSFLGLINTTPPPPFSQPSATCTDPVAAPCSSVGCVGRCADVVTSVQRWRSNPMLAGILDGFARAEVLAVLPFGGSTPWARIAFSGLLQVVRAGVVVLGPWQCGMDFPFFGGGVMTLPTLSPIAAATLDDDQIEFTLTVVLALKACGVDDGNRPNFSYGGSLFLPGTWVES